MNKSQTVRMVLLYSENKYGEKQDLPDRDISVSLQMIKRRDGRKSWRMYAEDLRTGKVAVVPDDIRPMLDLLPQEYVSEAMKEYVQSKAEHPMLPFN